MRSIYLCALLALLCSCNAYKLVRESTFETAMAIESVVPEGSEPPVYKEGDLPSDIPGFYPYARMHSSFTPSASQDSQVRSLFKWLERRKLSPDILLFQPLGTRYAGSVSNYIGFGVSTSSPVYAAQSVMWCCRLYPARIGLKRDKDGMILAVEESVRESSGIQEGDTLLNIDGLTTKRGDQDPLSEFGEKLISMKPGDEVTLVWIRPGDGRMQGKAKLLPPKPMSKAPTIYKEKREPGKATWDS